MARDKLRATGIATGETAAEIAALAFSNIGIQWTATGCTDFCWGISNLAGIPFFDLENKTTNNDPRTPQDVTYLVPHQWANDTVGDGWSLVSNSNSVITLKQILQQGDI